MLGGSRRRGMYRRSMTENCQVFNDLEAVGLELLEWYVATGRRRASHLPESPSPASTSKTLAVIHRQQTTLAPRSATATLTLKKKEPLHVDPHSSTRTDCHNRKIFYSQGL